MREVLDAEYREAWTWVEEVCYWLEVTRPVLWFAAVCGGYLYGLIVGLDLGFGAGFDLGVFR